MVQKATAVRTRTASIHLVAQSQIRRALFTWDAVDWTELAAQRPTERFTSVAANCQLPKTCTFGR